MTIMKKTILSIILLLFALGAQAKIVTGEVAREAAGKFLRSSSLELVWDGETSATKTQNTAPAFYVFNKADGGWVVISAEDCTDPVLAYSNTGSFKTAGMPDNIQWWFGDLRSAILDARSRKIEASDEVRELWKNIGQRTKATRGVELETAKWDQDAPYNNLCPKVTGETSRAVTGCVATSTCIYMRYLKWPEKGLGTLPDYYTETKRHHVPSLDISDHVYEWDNMPLVYNNKSTDEQNTQVARLMHDVGVALHLDYSSSGTAGYTSDVPMVLAKYFSYDNTGYECMRSNYYDNEWLKILESELDAGYPVMYGGSGNDGGHAFLIDGYDSNDKLRVNWGWSGDDDGYYTLALKIPGKYTFGQLQSAVLGMRPTTTYGDHFSGQAVELILEGYDKLSGLAIKSGEIAQGSQFTISAGYIWNYAQGAALSVNYNGAIKAALVDCYGNLKEYISSEVPYEMEAGYGDDLEFSCNITGPAVPGDRVCLYYKQTNGNWIPMHYTHDDGKTVGELGVVDAVFIAPPAQCKSGELYYFSVIPGRQPVKNQVWYYDGEKQTGACVMLSPGVHTVKAEVVIKGSYQETIVADFKVE